MIETITITLDAEPGRVYVIKPLGEKLAEVPIPVADGPGIIPLTGCITQAGGKTDNDTDCSF
jgi:hypothetical protein